MKKNCVVAEEYPQHVYCKGPFIDEEVKAANALLPTRSNNPTSNYSGVCFCKHPDTWNAYIHIKNKKCHIGIFKSEIDAAKAYDIVAKELSNKDLNFGEELRQREVSFSFFNPFFFLIRNTSCS
jgi:hypothetical protein